MSMTDPIADMLTRIRNAVSVRRKTVDVPLSKMKKAVAEVLKREGYVADYQVSEEGRHGLIRIYLKYSRLGEPVIQQIRRESKPGRRVYREVGEMAPVLRGIGIAVVSTSKGVLSDRECRREKVGGEVICSVW
jgi:small subunit ribosomal protein S8